MILRDFFPSRILAVASLVVSAGCVGRVGTPRASDMAADEAAVRRVEEQVAAATERNDADALAALMTPDFMFVNPAGVLLTKQQYLDMERSGRLRNGKYQISDVHVRVFGDAAVVTYRSNVIGSGMGELAPQRWRTTMLVKRDGKWLVAAQQSTPILTYDPAVGTWELDLTQSSFTPGPAVRSQTRTYTQTPDGVRFVLEGVSATGAPMHTEYTARYDGKDYPLIGAGYTNWIALTRINTVRTDGVEKKDGRPVYTVSRIVSTDSRTMTITVNGRNVRGDSVANVLVFRRR